MENCLNYHYALFKYGVICNQKTKSSKDKKMSSESSDMNKKFFCYLYEKGM